MSKRGVQVSDPNSTVLVVNNSTGAICLPREHNKDIIFGPDDIAQVTWAEYVKFKNIPFFGKYIKLDESVVISDGKVKISNIVGDLSNDEMVDLLPQSISALKEFAMALNPAEIYIFKMFLEGRSKIGIETEKCDEVVAFILKEFPEKEPEKVTVKVKKEDSPQEDTPKPKAKVKAKVKQTNIKGKTIVESEEYLTAQLITDDTEDSD